jgi:hypothetical protein
MAEGEGGRPRDAGRRRRRRIAGGGAAALGRICPRVSSARRSYASSHPRPVCASKAFAARSSERRRELGRVHQPRFGIPNLFRDPPSRREALLRPPAGGAFQSRASPDKLEIATVTLAGRGALANLVVHAVGWSSLRGWSGGRRHRGGTPCLVHLIDARVSRRARPKAELTIQLTRLMFPLPSSRSRSRGRRGGQLGDAEHQRDASGVPASASELLQTWDLSSRDSFGGLVARTRVRERRRPARRSGE